MRAVKKIFMILAVIAGIYLIFNLICFAAFKSAKPVRVTAAHLTDTAFTDKYIRDSGFIEHTDYEKWYMDLQVAGVSIFFGPHDMCYSGIIYVSEEEGKKLLEKYDWEKNDSELPELSEVELGDLETDDWYQSGKFVNDTFSIRVYDARFNGRNAIVFTACDS